MLRARNVSKVYPARDGKSGELRLFRELNFEVSRGEMVAIVGRSGAGKSSLLHLLAGLEAPSSGEVWVGATTLQGQHAQDAAKLRNRLIGYVWQFHYLLPEFTAVENVALPLMAGGEPRKKALAQARNWLQRVELEGRADHRSGELSGGEQQRVAIARALVTGPALLLADEPTGDLDEETSRHLFGLLQRLCREQQLAAVLVTHNLEVAHGCDRAFRLSDGCLEPVARSSGRERL